MTGLAIVSQIAEVKDHPNPEKAHLGVFILNSGAQLIGVNNEDGSRRFKVGDLLVHVKPGAIIPEHIIKNGFENVKGGKIKASRFAGVESEGIMLNLVFDGEYFIPKALQSNDFNTHWDSVIVGQDVSEIIGVKSS